MIGVETGGSNVQFAVDPATGRQVLIEMNPRVSRSSALASKATGFPIAKIAALLAVGYRLDEIMQRHHRRDAGGVRADPRLRRGEDPSVRVREVPRGLAGAVLHDEVGRGDDGDRADVHRGAGQGVARDREARAGPFVGRRRPGSPTSPSPGETRLHARRRPARGRRDDRGGRRGVRRSTRGSSTGSPRSSEGNDALRDQPLHTLGEAELLAAKRLGISDARIGALTGATEASGPPASRRARRAAGVQDGRHLRRGVPGAHAVPLLHV